MTVEEERARNEQSLETKERLERNEKENKALTASLKMEREERQKESADLDRHEERLKADTKVRAPPVQYGQKTPLLRFMWTSTVHMK